MRRINLEQFEYWCAERKENYRRESIPAENAHSLNKYLRNILGIEDQEYVDNCQKYFDEFLKSCIENYSQLIGPVAWDLGSGVGPRYERPKVRIDFNKLFGERDIINDPKPHLYSLNISCIDRAEICNGVIHSVSIGQHCSEISFENCQIGSLVVGDGAATRLEIKDSLIGQLRLLPNCTRDLDLIRGSVRAIDCNTSKNPFMGDVYVSPNTVFPTSHRWKLIIGSQSYRDIRAHLESLGNTLASNRFRSLELRFDRSNETGLNWLSNVLYGVCAEYGFRPGRALLAALILYLFAAAVLYAFDGAAAGLDPAFYTEWRQILIAPSLEGNISRSLTLPAQSILSPFGAFGLRKLVVASHWGWQVFAVLHALFTYLLFLMVILGIRKRFKIS